MNKDPLKKVTNVTRRKTVLFGPITDLYMTIYRSLEETIIQIVPHFTKSYPPHLLIRLSLLLSRVTTVDEKWRKMQQMFLFFFFFLWFDLNHVLIVL